MASDQGHFDTISGQTTTGHEWDGIRELNTPLPRWWLWLFYLTIAFSLVYWFLYPAWPERLAQPLEQLHHCGEFVFARALRTPDHSAPGLGFRLSYDTNRQIKF